MRSKPSSPFPVRPAPLIVRRIITGILNGSVASGSLLSGERPPPTVASLRVGRISDHDRVPLATAEHMEDNADAIAAVDGHVHGWRPQPTGAAPQGPWNRK